MKIIEDYLNNLYKNDDSKEAKELKEELKEHLITSVNEFISQGYKIDEAQKKAIEQFDDGSDTTTELRSIYTQKIDIRKEKLKKLRKLRWTFVNITGWLIGAAFFAAYQNLQNIVPAWLIILISSSAIVLIILSILISMTNKKIEGN